MVLRNDKPIEKSMLVNKLLKERCESRKIYLIDHMKISPKSDCNRSRLHLNYTGTTILIAYVNLIEIQRLRVGISGLTSMLIRKKQLMNQKR